MRTHPLLLSLAGLALVGACGRGSDSHQDDALKNDLALAAQAQSYTPSQFMSPSEQQQQLGATAAAARYANAPRAPQQVYRSPTPVRRAPARRTASRTRRSGGYGANDGSYGSYPSVPNDPPEPQRNTKRDAVIGAAAGAVIGATTSRDRVKGGIIGAAAGGILGGIIGHTVDVKRY
jgi:hypothetical protein